MAKTTDISNSKIEKQWLVYILRCKDDTLYTGITNDLTERVKKHNAGTASKYTRVRTPVKVIYQELATGRSEATKRELAIKNLTRKQKLKLAG